MRNLLLLIAKYSSTILFIILEVICFFIIVSFNKSQSEIWAHSANLFSGNIDERVQNTTNFFNLEAVNDSLLRENARLLETIINYRVVSKENDFQEYEALDSTQLEYKFIPSRITGKTFNKRNNHITLNKGSIDSIKVGMGVISKDGLLGLVKSVSKNYSLVMTVLHSQCRISAAIKNNDFHGTLLWDNMDPTMMNLINIPKHADVSVGDTIITSGYSTVFPYGIEIGTIYESEDNEDSFSVKVKLFNDLPSETHAYIVSSKDRKEKTELEEEIQDEF